MRGSELPLFSKVLYKLVLWLKGKSNAHIDQINLNILNNKQACMTSLLNHSLVERKDELVFDQWLTTIVQGLRNSLMLIRTTIKYFYRYLYLKS